jgi:GAF domain
MPKFEVYIPATDPGGLSMTLKVGAENWMAALKAGLTKLGEQGTVSQNVMVDIQDDDSIHITEAHSGRVFRIRELSPDEAMRAQVKRPSQITRPPPQPSAAKTLVSPALGAPPSRDLDTARTLPGIPALQLTPPPAVSPPVRPPRPPVPGAGGPRPSAPPAPRAPGAPGPRPSAPGAPRASAPPAPAPTPPAAAAAARPGGRPHYKSSPRIEVPDVEELVQPVKPVQKPIGRARSGPAEVASHRAMTEDLLSDIFLRVVALDGMTSVEEAMDFILDLALEKVPCESGSVFRADGTTGDLSFITARGPKAREVLAANLIIPAGTGIAGFCAVEGVSVAVNNVERDPRFYAAVSQRVDYQPRSMLCAPMMTHGRSFGCVQIINRRAGPQFEEHEVGVLAYLAHQAALFLNDRLLR